MMPIILQKVSSFQLCGAIDAEVGCLLLTNKN